MRETRLELDDATIRAIEHGLPTVTVMAGQFPYAIEAWPEAVCVAGNCAFWDSVMTGLRAAQHNEHARGTLQILTHILTRG